MALWPGHRNNLLEGQNQDTGLLIPTRIRFAIFPVCLFLVSREWVIL